MNNLIKKLPIYLWILFFCSIHCGKLSKDPEFERLPIKRNTNKIVQPGVTAFRIVAPQSCQRVFGLDESNSTPQTIKGRDYPPVVVRIRVSINDRGHARIIWSDAPKLEPGNDIRNIVKTWNRFRPYKTGTIKYLINIGGHEIRVDTRDLYPPSEFSQDKIIDGTLAKFDNYFNNVDYSTELNF